MRRKRLVALASLTLILVVVVWYTPLTTHAKVLLLLSQELPQSPVKPLGLLTPEPIHAQRQLQSPHGPVVADLFLPAARFGRPQPRRRPAVILALGVKLAEERDRPILLGFARTLARLGFVVLWPRLEALDAGAALPEEPDTFVAGIRFLEGLDLVDGERISLLGFSVGASTALVAASDPQVAARVHGVIFFGGYYDLFAYLLSVATSSTVLDGQISTWQPHEQVVNRTREMLQAKGADGVLRIFDATGRDEAESRLESAPAAELAALRRLDPAAHVAGVRARLFILHDRGDVFVPYVESIKLRRALPQGSEKAFLLTGLFEHAQPKGGVSWQVVQDVARLYGFVYAALAFL